MGRAQGVADIGDHHGGSPVGDQGTVGALQGTGDDRIFLRNLAAELVAQILAQLGVRVGDAVLVVLGGNRGERVGLIAMFLEVLLRDPGENAREAALDFTFLLQVGGFQQNAADLGAGKGGHLLDADDEHEAGLLGLDRLHALMQRRGSCGAGVLDSRRRLEAKGIVGLQDQGGREALGREALVVGAQHQFVDVPDLEPCVGDGCGRDLEDQGLDVLAFVLAKGGVAPTDDAGCHDSCLSRVSRASNFGRGI